MTKGEIKLLQEWTRSGTTTPHNNKLDICLFVVVIIGMFEQEHPTTGLHLQSFVSSLLGTCEYQSTYLLRACARAWNHPHFDV